MILAALLLHLIVQQPGEALAEVRRLPLVEHWDRNISVYVSFDGSTPTTLSRCPTAKGGSEQLRKDLKGGCEQLRKDLYLRVAPELWAGMKDGDDPIGYSFYLYRDAAMSQYVNPLNEPPHGDWPGHIASFHDLAARSGEWGPYRALYYSNFTLAIRVLEYELVQAQVPESTLRNLGLKQPLQAFKRFSALVCVEPARRSPRHVHEH